MPRRRSNERYRSPAYPKNGPGNRDTSLPGLTRQHDTHCAAETLEELRVFGLHRPE